MPRRPIETTAVAAALRAILTADATAAAEENVLVARDEAGDLHPYLFRLQQRMREEGGSGTRVRVDDLVERAMQEALAVWERVNPEKQARDHRWLALDEIEEIRKIDADLGGLTEQAAARARADRADAEGPTTIREFFEAYDFAGRNLHEQSLPGGSRVRARVGDPDRAELPDGARHAFDFYYRAEAAGVATVSLHRGEVAGQSVLVVYMSTDGDAAFLEVLRDDGATVDGARLHAHQILAWDEFPGRVRLSSTLVNLEEFAREEGLSEFDERAAAGQPPHRWPGEASFDSALLYPVGQQLGRIELGEPVPRDELRDVAVAALDYLWGLTLRHRVRHDGRPVDLGPRAAGVLTVGSFTRPTDGETYLVANWRDIDDASFVLYYRRGDLGVRLTIEQFDN